METYITHHSDRFYESLFISYCSILTAAESVALLHVDTKERNNPYHWKHYVDETNKLITKLRNMLPDYDKRRENFKLLIADDYEKKAVKFFEADFY